MYLTDLADFARTSGLRVVEIDGWRTRGRDGAFDPEGVLCHHTGSYDSLTDAESDLDYARWLAITGRLDLAAPLCQLALSAECVVYVCAAGRANHAGTARASGPMPAGDGNQLYIGIEAMNDGSQGWGSLGRDAVGNPLTQGEAYARLCAALCRGYRWPAPHVRAHAETSVTGKWDPGLLDMDNHRAAVARLITDPQEDDMFSDKDRALLERIATAQAAETDRAAARDAAERERDKAAAERLARMRGNVHRRDVVIERLAKAANADLAEIRRELAAQDAQE